MPDKIPSETNNNNEAKPTPTKGKVASKATGKRRKTTDTKLPKKGTVKKKQVSIPVSSFPRTPIDKSIELVQMIYQNFGQNSVPWDTAASLVGRSPKTVPFKYLIWSTESYGLILKDEDKNYSLTELSRKIVASTYQNEDKEAILKAIMTPSTLSRFYSDYDKHPLPDDKFLPNILDQKYGLPIDRYEEYKNIIVENAKIGHILKANEDTGQLYIYLSNRDNNDIPENTESRFIELDPVDNYVSEVSIDSESGTAKKTSSDFSNVCFVITPIGDDGSEHRKHADLMFKHLIQPVVAAAGLNAIRADTISKPGIITQQIFEYLVKSRLCICDLSYNNPNVFYELGIRHMSLLPNIQIIRKEDKIPFDVSQGRTIMIDLEDKFSIIDRIDSAKRELTDQIKSALSPDQKEISDDNPVKYYIPGIIVKIPK